VTPVENWQRFLVPVNFDRVSLEAVHVAGAVAKPRRGVLHLVHVIEVGRSLPLNVELEQESRRAEQILERARLAAADSGCSNVRATVVQAREAGPAILEEARAHHIDVIVLGLPPFQGEDRPFAIGPTAEYLLRHAPCEVWLIRRPMRDFTRGGHEGP
jgi:nucleotide-binding universal stress UspA family protein